MGRRLNYKGGKRSKKNIICFRCKGNYYLSQCKEPRQEMSKCREQMETLKKLEMVKHKDSSSLTYLKREINGK
jgi:hypothetical protein